MTDAAAVGALGFAETVARIQVAEALGYPELPTKLALAAA